MPQRVIQLTLLKELLILTEAKADVTATDGRNRTPLHVAAVEGHNDIVKQLLAAGANPNANNNWGYTPLHLAKLENEQMVIRLLENAIMSN